MTKTNDSPRDLMSESSTLADIEAVAEHFTGKRRDAFLASIAVARECAKLGGWCSRGHQQASKGLSKGLASHKSLFEQARHYDDPRRAPLFRCYMAASYGSALGQDELDVVTDTDLEALAPKIPLAVTRAWLRLMVVLHAVFADLDASRPQPVYTEIGLSPKVTKTLQDAELELDLTTRRLCPLGWYWDDMRDKDGKVVLRRDGTPAQQKVYFADWPDGTIFDASRFAQHDCEACGKRIPSGAVVPCLVSDKAGRPLGFWFGRDCARNILGIKDAGIADTREAKR